MLFEGKCFYKGKILSFKKDKNQQNVSWDYTYPIKRINFGEKNLSSKLNFKKKKHDNWLDKVFKDFRC